MTDDEFDLRLRQALRPLVTEHVPASVAREAGPATWRRRPIGVRGLAVPSVVVVMAIVGAFALPRIAGLLGPQVVPSPVVGTAASAAKIATADGDVSVRTSADGTHLELVLEKDARTSVVLASIAEPAPPRETGFDFLSMHVVDCPASTGLAQQYYILGQSTTSGTVVLHGIGGTAAKMVGGRYVIAIMAGSIPSGPWSYDIGESPLRPSAWGLGSTFLTLPSYGEKSPAGCFFDPH